MADHSAPLPGRDFPSSPNDSGGCGKQCFCGTDRSLHRMQKSLPLFRRKPESRQFLMIAGLGPGLRRGDDAAGNDYSSISVAVFPRRPVNDRFFIALSLTRNLRHETLRYMAMYRLWSIREFMAAVKALGDENRVRALLALRKGELCLCQITELLGLAPSTVSKHMSILHQARLVDARKCGRWVYYRLAGEDSGPEIQEAIAWLCESLSKDAVARQDERRLRDVLKQDLTVLCSKQGRKLNEK